MLVLQVHTFEVNIGIKLIRRVVENVRVKSEKVCDMTELNSSIATYQMTQCFCSNL